jgi:hypothetical protein
MNARLLLLAAALTLSCLGCVRKNGQTFSENGITVTVPAAPTKGQQTTSTVVGNITIYTYTVEFRNEAYAVVYNDYPVSAVERLTHTARLLDGGRTGAVANINGTPTEEHKLCSPVMRSGSSALTRRKKAPR